MAESLVTQAFQPVQRRLKPAATIWIKLETENEKSNLRILLTGPPRCGKTTVVADALIAFTSL